MPAVPAAWSVTTIAFIVPLPSYVGILRIPLQTAENTTRELSGNTSTRDLAPRHADSNLCAKRCPLRAKSRHRTDLHRLGFPKHEARSNGRVDHLVSERHTRKVVATVAGALRSNQVVWVETPKFIDRLVDVVVSERGHHMEAANDSMHLVDARGFFLLAHRIEHRAVATPTQAHHG